MIKIINTTMFTLKVDNYESSLHRLNTLKVFVGLNIFTKIFDIYGLDERFLFKIFFGFLFGGKQSLACITCLA